MVTLAESTDPIVIPELPSGSVKDFIPYLAKNPDTLMSKIIEPYKAFESELRKVYAQQPEHEAVKDGKVNMVPIFAGHEHYLKIRARSLDTESEEEKSKYIMTLKKEDRKANGSPAVVSSFQGFQQNFNLFSESSLCDLNWNNVVAAGSAVTTALLPVPEKWAGSKRSLREYYHEHLAPASDVDLFLFGLNEEQALEKIKQIEKNVKDSILHEVTTIRTKNAITIASQHPTRHVQIVLRLYDSISQIITGFDVDCACAAYDGKQVYAAPRAIAAFLTQSNTIDLTRRSPSYENRLSKYSHRGFEVYWPLLDRTRIDPTIFERSFGRTQGLARLLILEKLPKTSDRDSYMDQRRTERGRPAINRGYRNQYSMSGNIKEREEDEIAEWADQEEVASYHTMTVPYGPKYFAGRINRLLYAKDLLLNAEWNQQKDREVYLHRHPCFFGTAEEVLQDCCGFCPIPKTDEEIVIAEEESKTMVSGGLKFIMDDPGRQEIGSFNPITDHEWTTMAYVGDTARLCQAIVDGDLEHVEDWCSQEGVDVNRRDYTGRTPLHLAVMTSTTEIVKCLIDHDARLIARLVDGRTALHIAAARGNVEMVKALMDRSLANEEQEEEKEDARRVARKAERATAAGDDQQAKDKSDEEDDASSEASEITLESEGNSDSMTMGSFVKIDNEKQAQEDAVLEDSSEDPDFYDINVIAWDYGLSPLHLAILNGHEELIDLLASEYGADVLLPVKLVEPESSTLKAAIMSILLAMALPPEKAKKIVKQLLELGATSAQGDMNHVTAFHYIVAKDNSDVLDILLENDRPVAMSVLNNIGSDGASYNATINSPLTTAIDKGYNGMVSKLLSLGAKTTIDFDDWVKTHLATNQWAKNWDSETTKTKYQDSVVQPIILAAGKGMGQAVEDLLAHGADPATLEKTAYTVLKNPQSASYNIAESLLDIIQKKLKLLREYKDPVQNEKEPEKLRSEAFYTSGFKKGTYQYWSALKNFQVAKESNKTAWEKYKKRREGKTEGVKEKREAIEKLTRELEKAEKALIGAGSKSFESMHSEIPKHVRHNHRYTPPEPLPYETSLNFLTPDLNDTKCQGYVSLFEAAWSNDLEKIKSLTLAPWASPPLPLQTPLKVAIQDGNGFSPFSIAMLRGHYEMAKKIIEICITQYHKDDGLSTRQRWNMRTGDSDDENSDYDSEDETGHEHLPIFSELVSDNFTVDNLGEVSNIVKSDVLPLTMVEWACIPQRLEDSTNDGLSARRTLLGHAVEADNMKLFKFIMELGAEQQALLAEEDDDQKCYTVSREVFYSAIRLGRTTMLGEMIKATGAGIPLNDLIQKSGIEVKTKPKYYQGLSVGGKKRADWAQAPGGTSYVVEEKVPPLLQSAHMGSVESVEWFMSDAPKRRYKEFAENNKSDKRIKTLEASGKGFDNIIGKWLNAKNELAIHSAILYSFGENELPKYIALIKHLTSVMPECLEQKSSEGWTPLQVAVLHERANIAQHLISIGANQRSRDKMGRNMVHSMVAYRHGASRTDANWIQNMIEVFDREAVKEMLAERCAMHPGALTPLGYWMSASNGEYKKSDIIAELAKFSSGDDLEMINGEGDLPLHVAVRKNLSTITSYLLSLNPFLLYRENATGRTPLEMSRDTYIASQVTRPPSVGSGYWEQYRPGQDEYNFITQKHPSEFVKKDTTEESQKRTWEICNEVDAKMIKEGRERKRRLVSLFEANEVAKRVAGLKRSYGVVVNGGLVDVDSRPDIISEWL